jgi:hypothetical protein
MEQFKEALARGKDGLDTAVGLYKWARDNIKKMKKFDPSYRQEWAEQQIFSTFGISAEVYIRAVTRFGGGESKKHVDAGRAIVEKIGLDEIFAAEKKLDQKEMEKLAKMVTKNTTAENFQDLVSKLYAEYQAGLAEEAKNGKKKREDYKALYFDLKEKYAALKAKAETQEAEIKRLWKVVEGKQEIKRKPKSRKKAAVAAR